MMNSVPDYALLLAGHGERFPPRVSRLVQLGDDLGEVGWKEAREAAAALGLSSKEMPNL